MEMTGRRPDTFSARRRWLSRIHVLIAVFLSLYVVVVVNVLVYRHPVRIDLTEEGLFSLSDESKAKLDLVREKVHVIVGYYQQPQNAQHVSYVRVLNRALRLLKEFHARQPLVEVLTHVDVFEEPDRWRTLCETYDLAPTQLNRMTFIAGEGRNSLKQSLTPEDLAVFGRANDPAIPPSIEEFRGERAITAAIMKLVNREKEKVYFLAGHGELVLTPGGSEAPAGLGALRHDLESSGYEPQELSLLEAGRVPEDCSLLVIAAPRQMLSEEELDLVERYLLDDGRLLVTLADERSGIEEILEKWGVRAHEERVLSRVRLPGQRVDRSWVSVGEYNAGHAVTSPFDNASRFQMLFWLPRRLEIEGGPRTARTEPLVSTGRATDAESFFLVRGADDLVESDRDESLVLATATMSDLRGRPPPDWKERKTRMVVVGASNFLRDADARSQVHGGYLSASHRDFFMNCVHWLTGHESLMAAGGRETVKRQLPPLRGGLGRFLYLASVLIFPGVFGLTGVAIYFLRRV